MELWVRGQNRESLIKVYDIWIDDTDMVDKKYVSVMANSRFSFELGTYKTKERALEVLDEIQKCLCADFIFNGTYQEIDAQLKAKMTNALYGFIYEMPKE